MGNRLIKSALALTLFVFVSESCTLSVTTGDDAGPGPGTGAPEFPTVTLEPGSPMAMVELEVPDEANFVLRATLPVPPGVWPSADGQVPAAVVDYDGTVVPAQVETVSRYAQDELGADVIEVLARVRRDPAVAHGTRVTYEVQYAPHAPAASPGTAGIEDLAAGATPIPADLTSLLGNPANLRIISTDVFGHKYETRPLAGANAKLYRYGEVVSQLRTFDVMMPVSPAAGTTGTLPHFFGVHSYMSVSANESVLLLDVRFDNGADGNDTATDTDDPLSKVYFEDLEIQVPNGWVVLQDAVDPFVGNLYSGGGGKRLPIVKPIGDGTMHVMPSQGQFHRRLAIAPAALANRAQSMLDLSGLAFVKKATDSGTGAELLSWNYPGLARYFPQAHDLPTFEHIGLESLRTTLSAEFQNLRSDLVNGTHGADYPVLAGNLGWAHPFGIGYGGMTGGAEINLYQGVRTAAARSADGYHHLMDNHRMAADRMPVTLYHADGQPSRVANWLEQGTDYTYVPFFYFNGKDNGGSDPFGYNVAPTFQVEYVEANNLQPSYEAELLGYQAHDTQHLIRFTHTPKALAWLGNDAISKDDILMSAENFHFEYHEHFNSFYKHVQSTGLMQDVNDVAANPGKGFVIGRGQGWGIDANNAAMALSKDDAWRAETRDWMAIITETFSAGQADCSGIIQSQVISHLFDSKYKARQSIEGAILENAIRGMQKRAFEGVDATRTAMLEDILHDSYYGMIAPMAWDPGNSAPFSHLAVAPLAAGAVPYCTPGDVPADGVDQYLDAFQIWSSLAYAYEMTLNPVFLTYAEKMTGGPLRITLEADGTGNIGNKAALLALAQEIE